MVEKAFAQYQEGCITLAEFLAVLIADYAAKQAMTTDCLTCGSDLSGRLG